MSYAAPVQVPGYFAPAPVAYYALLRLQQVASVLSLSCPPSTPALVLEYIAPAPAVLCCTCACHGVHRAGTTNVLRRASTSTGILRACVFSICRTFCNCNREFQFSPCRAHRLHLHLLWSTSRRHHNGMRHHACLNVHRANWDARAQFFTQRRDIPNVKMKIDLSVARCVCACQISCLWRTSTLLAATIGCGQQVHFRIL